MAGTKTNYFNVLKPVPLKAACLRKANGSSLQANQRVYCWYLKAQKRAKISPTAENMEHFRVQRAKFRKTVRTSRRHSWQTFV